MPTPEHNKAREDIKNRIESIVSQIIHQKNELEKAQRDVITLSKINNLKINWETGKVDRNG